MSNPSLSYSQYTAPPPAFGGPPPPLSHGYYGPPPPAGRVGKNPVFYKKITSPVGFLGFLVYIWVFWFIFGFFGFFIYIFAQKREFLGFFQFKEYF
jgi:hypothetical protein